LAVRNDFKLCKLCQITTHAGTFLQTFVDLSAEPGAGELFDRSNCPRRSALQIARTQIGPNTLRPTVRQLRSLSHALSRRNSKEAGAVAAGLLLASLDALQVMSQ
jgi:hypothetical protein